MHEPDPDWWRSWFGPAYLAIYDEYLAERTAVETDQLEVLLRIRPPMRVLDLPCGQGRHAIELARRGYSVTGVDLSPYMLSVARGRAQEAQVSVSFLRGDMRVPLKGAAFDVVLNLFTSFGYFADESDDGRVVRAAASMLEPNGRFLLEVINGDQVMASFQEREWFTVGEAAVTERRSLDRALRRMVVERTVTRDSGEEVSTHMIRLYGARELEAVLADAGFDRIDLYGDWDGSPPSGASRRLLAVATKTKGGS